MGAEGASAPSGRKVLALLVALFAVGILVLVQATMAQRDEPPPSNAPTESTARTGE